MALLVPRDQHHAAAIRAWEAIQAARREIVTTNLVAGESHAMISRRAGVAAGLQFLDSLMVAGPQRVMWADAEVTQSAVEHWLRRYRNKILSLTDAVSFEMMRREQIRVAFCYDNDFRTAGFEIFNP